MTITTSYIPLLPMTGGQAHDIAGQVATLLLLAADAKAPVLTMDWNWSEGFSLHVRSIEAAKAIVAMFVAEFVNTAQPSGHWIHHIWRTNDAGFGIGKLRITALSDTTGAKP